MKKIIFLVPVILATLIFASCQRSVNPQTSSKNLNNNSISQNESMTEEICYIPTSYATEEEFLTWLESQEKFDEKYRRLFATDKVRFKFKKIPEGYNLSSISVQMNLVTYHYKKADEEVYMYFQYSTIHYFDIDEGSKSKTFEQKVEYFDQKVQKDNIAYYIGYPKTLHDEVLRGAVNWNIDNYRCTIYTVGIKSFDESIIDYCKFEKVPLK